MISVYSDHRVWRSSDSARYFFRSALMYTTSVRCVSLPLIPWSDEGSCPLPDSYRWWRSVSDCPGTGLSLVYPIETEHPVSSLKHNTNPCWLRWWGGLKLFSWSLRYLRILDLILTESSSNLCSGAIILWSSLANLRIVNKKLRN